MKRAVCFDEFAYQCPFFNSDHDFNNGYCCNHPEQEEVAKDDDGNNVGLCYGFSCPLGCIAEQEDKDDPEYSKNINWDGNCEDGEVGEDEYLLVEEGEDATEDQKKALFAYDRYLHRYNQQWLDEHKEP